MSLPLPKLIVGVATDSRIIIITQATWVDVAMAERSLIDHRKPTMVPGWVNVDSVCDVVATLVAVMFTMTSSFCIGLVRPPRTMTWVPVPRARFICSFGGPEVSRLVLPAHFGSGTISIFPWNSL